MTSSDLARYVGFIERQLSELVAEAAPLIATAAFKGGSLYYKAWVDKARGLGFEIIDPTIHPTQEGEGTHGKLDDQRGVE